MVQKGTERQGGRRSARMARVIWIGGWCLCACLLLGGRWEVSNFGTQGDIPLHYQVTRVMGQALREGTGWIEWAGLLDGGRGDRFFTFYPRLFYWLAALPEWILGLSRWSSLRLAILLVIVFNQATAYCLARRFFGPRESGWVGLGYVLFPGWAMIGLNRGFLPQSLGMGFLPLVVLGVVDLLGKERRAKGVGWLIVGLCGMAMTHVLSSYLAHLVVGVLGAGTLLGWLGLKFRRGRREGGGLRETGLPRLALGVGWSAGLMALVWLPLLQGLSEVQVGLQVARQDYRDYLLFAPAADGTAYRMAWAGFNDVASLVVLGQTALVGILWLGLRREGQPLEWLAHRGALLALAGLGIAIPWLGWIWEVVPGLPYLQFPWRWQPVTALVGALLLVATWRDRRRLGGWRGRLVFPLGGILVLGLGTLTAMLVGLWPGSDRAEAEKSARLEWLEGKRRVDPLSFEEGLRLQDAGAAEFLGYTANQVYFRPRGAEMTLHGVVEAPGGLEIVAGEGAVEVLSQRLESRAFRLVNRTAVKARLLTYADAHWRAELDGVPLPIATEPSSGLMLMEVPAGSHRLTIAYRPPRGPWWISLIAGAVGLLVIGQKVLGGRKRRARLV